MKPSSATNAYQGPDLDGRPKFDVVIIYEDSAAGNPRWLRCLTNVE